MPYGSDTYGSLLYSGSPAGVIGGIHPPGISSSETFGALTVPPIPRASPSGISSSETFGSTTVSGGATASYIQTLVNTATSGAPVTVTLTSTPSIPSVGNTLLAFIVRSNNQVFTSGTDSKGNTWVQDVVRAPGGATAAIWRCSSYTTALATGDTVTFSGGLSLGIVDIRIIEVAGLIASPLDKTNIADTSINSPTGSISISSGTLTQTNEFDVALVANDGTAGTFTYTVSGSGGISLEPAF